MLNMIRLMNTPVLIILVASAKTNICMRKIMVRNINRVVIIIVIMVLVKIIVLINSTKRITG